MSSIQILIILLSIFTIGKLIFDFKKSKISAPIFLFWLSLWILVLLFVSLPQFVHFLEDILLGSGRGVDAIVYFSIILIFFVLFKIINRLEKTRREITEIVRSNALKKKD